MRPQRFTVLVLGLALPCVLLPFATPGQVIAPRLTTDGKTLILLEEIQNPPEKRQPLVTLEFPPTLGTRYIRVAGKGIAPPETVDVQCGLYSWTVARSEVRQVGDRTHAFFTVEPEVAEAMLGGPVCQLVVAGVKIPIPRDLLWAVWAAPSKGKAPPRVDVGDSGREEGMTWWS